MVLLETSDGRRIRVDLTLLNRSLVIREMCRVSEDSADGDFVLPLHGIRSKVLLKILLWAEFHKGHEEPAWVANSDPIMSSEMEVRTSDWDKEFLRVEMDTLCELMEGCNYLEIPWLFKLCAQKLVGQSRQLPESQFSKYLDKIPSLAEIQGLFTEQPVEKRSSSP
ncbi:E3 ubiquitin ligase complex SCF subunit sconC [Drosophila ficusphila]|uniref:E3 ubiquitin ligase complex SCF subunit sconC n=1 Tax=Drosophila ficusphila TaxID=30025 RepID=UPI0007E725F6|nr:E3 ubiquitin ligase complex SCF subunit sconC [Drosophila ficusphila]